MDTGLAKKFRSYWELVDLKIRENVDGLREGHAGFNHDNLLPCFAGMNVATCYQYTSARLKCSVLFLFLTGF